jgi:hypothetical protein
MAPMSQRSQRMGVLVRLEEPARHLDGDFSCSRPVRRWLTSTSAELRGIDLRTHESRRELDGPEKGGRDQDTKG